jgi:hypothetical protein
MLSTAYLITIGIGEYKPHVCRTSPSHQYSRKGFVEALCSGLYYY